MSKWCREVTREDDDPHSPSSTRVSDVVTGTSKPSYQVREPIENDEETLAMKRGDMPPPVPKRVNNPRIQEDQAQLEFYSNSDKMHGTTPEDEFAQTWFDYGRSVFPQSVRKTGTHVELCNVPTYQCSILFNNIGSINRKSEFRKPENLNKPVSTKVKSSISPICHFSENSGETTTRMCF